MTPRCLPAFVSSPLMQTDSVGCQLVVATRHKQPGQAAKYTGDLMWYSFSTSSGLTKLPAARELEENRFCQNSLAVSRAYVVITAQVDRFFCYDHTGKLVASGLV